MGYAHESEAWHRLQAYSLALRCAWKKRKNVRFLIFAKSHKVYDNEKEYYLAKYYNKTKKNLAKNSKINLKIIIVECRKKTENIKTREEIHDGLEKI